MAEIKESSPIQEQPTASNNPPADWNYPGPSILQAILPLTVISAKYTGGRIGAGLTTIRNYKLVCNGGITWNAFSDSAEVCCDTHRRDPIFLQDLSGSIILRIDMSWTWCQNDEAIISAPPGNPIGSIEVKGDCCSKYYTLTNNFSEQKLIVEAKAEGFCKYDSYWFKLENGELKATVKSYEFRGSTLEIYSEIEPTMKAMLIAFLLIVVNFNRERRRAVMA